MATNTRNRVIYQSEALYVGQPSATGCHVNATIDADDAGVDTSERLFGLVKYPDSIDELCVYDNTEGWLNISTPVDLNIPEWDNVTAYTAGDMVKVTETVGADTGAVWHFEAQTDIDVDKAPIKSLQNFTDAGGSSGTLDFSNKTLTDWTFSLAVRQLNRVQSANYSFAFNRQDVNQFGQLHRIDSVAIDPPTVSLDFSYYLNNGANERLMGFFINDYPDMVAKTAKNFINIKDQEDDFEGRNYFILTTPQGEDAVKNSGWDTDGFPQDDSGHSVIALGNGYVTNYGVEASVGGMPTASITVEGLNLKSDAGFHNKNIPAVDNGRGTPIEGVKFSLPAPVSGVLDDGVAPDAAKDGNLFTGLAEGFSCLRPGDIEMHLGTDGEAGLMNPLPAGTPPTDHQPLGCHVQSFSIDMPMGRTPLQRLGTPYAYTRPLDMPLTVTITVSAIVADLKSSNIADHLFNFENHDLHFILREPQVDGAGPIALAFYAKGAQLEGESFSSSIGDNKSVDITFTCQVGGAEDTTRGLMAAGSRGAIPDKSAGQTYDEYPLLNRFDPATK